ncbi:MAG TPA: conjugal transfer protein [Castellaniella sp.]
MKSLIAALAFTGLLAGCAFHAPPPPQPADSPRVPVNATRPTPEGL